MKKLDVIGKQQTSLMRRISALEHQYWPHFSCNDMPGIRSYNDDMADIR